MNLLFKLLDPRQIIASFTLYMGGGGSSSGPSATSQTNTVSNIAPWAQAGVQQLIQSGLGNYFPQYGSELNTYNQQLAQYNAQGGASNPNLTAPTAPTDLGQQAGYTPFDPTNPTNNAGMASAITAGQNSVAAFQPLQNQSYTAASNMALPSQYGQATSLAGTAAQGNLGTVAGANQYGQAGYNAGMSYGQNAQNVNGAPSSTVQNYMNPYLQATLAPSLALMNQQYGMQNVANNAQATQAGAFGGSRMGVQNALTNQAQNLAQNQLIGNAYNQAYNTANQNMQQAATLGMQGAATGLQGVSGQQAGYNGAGTQATNLGSLGTQQLAGQQSIAGLQNAYGAQQQQQIQNQINQGAQNYSTQQAVPMQQLQQLEGLYTGAPTSTTTSNYAAAPSMLSQVAGLGMAGYGLSQLGSGSSTAAKANKKGGRIKEAGIDKLSAKNLESFKKGGITMDTEDDGAVHFDNNQQQPVSSDLGMYTVPGMVSLGPFGAQTGKQPQTSTTDQLSPFQRMLLSVGPYASMYKAAAGQTGNTNTQTPAVPGKVAAPNPAAPTQPGQPAGVGPDTRMTSGLGSLVPGAQGNPNATPAADPLSSAANIGMPSLLNTKALTPVQAQQAANQFYNDAQGNAEMRYDNAKDALYKSIEQEDAERSLLLQNRPMLGKKQEERLNKESEAAKEKLSDLKAMSWVEQGLATLAGTSPNAFVNLGTTKGIEAYKEGKKDLDKAEQARQEAYSHIDDMRDAQVNHDIDSEIAHRERATDKIQDFNKFGIQTLNTFDLARSGAGLGVFTNSENNAAANARANVSAGVSTRIANAQLDLQKLIHGSDTQAQNQFLAIQKQVDAEVAKAQQTNMLSPADAAAMRSARMNEEIAKNPLLSKYMTRMGAGIGGLPTSGLSATPTGNVIPSTSIF